MSAALKLVIEGATGQGRGRVLTPPYLGGVAPFAAYAFGLNNEPRIGREISGAGRVADVDRDAEVIGPGAPTTTGLVVNATTYVQAKFGGKTLLTAGSGSSTLFIVTRSAAGTDHGHITNNAAGEDSLILQTNSDNASVAYGFDVGVLDNAAGSGAQASRGAQIQTLGAIYSPTGVKIAFGSPGAGLTMSAIQLWTGAAPDGGDALFRIGYAGDGSVFIAAFYPIAVTLDQANLFNAWAHSVLAKDELV